MNNMYEILNGVFDGTGLTTQPTNSTEILNLVVTDDGSALKVKIDGGSSGALADEINVIENVGGYQIGDYIASGTTYDTIFHDMLEPVVYPTIQQSNYSTLYGVVTSNIEVGESFNLSLTSAYNQGIIDSKDSHPDISLTGPYNNTSYSGYGSVNATTGSVSATAGQGVMSWTVRKDYDAGTGNYYDSVGNVATNLDSHRVATYKNKTVSRNGRYKVWNGSSASPIPTDSTSIRSLPTYFFDTEGTLNFTITVPPGERYIAFYIKDRIVDTDIFVSHQESFDLDITNAYIPSSTVTVKDAAGVDVTYKMFLNDLGGTGYAGENHHDVVIS